MSVAPVSSPAPVSPSAPAPAPSPAASVSALSAPAPNPDTSEHQGLLELPLDELCLLAAKTRDQSFGWRMTFSPKVFIPLTKLCRDRCGYCTFAEPPARLSAPYMELDEVLEVARKGAEAGCHEALFTLGERPELRYPAAQDWLDQRGYGSTVDYLSAASKAVLDETGLLPHANAGAMFAQELAQLRQSCPSQGMMLETLNPNLSCHRNSPDKDPQRRLATLHEAGKLSIPFTTGILVGIGESLQDRLEALAAIAHAHRLYGHIQEVIVQNFLPKPGTAMHQSEPCPQDEFLQAIALARLVLPDDIHVQAPPNLSQDFGQLIAAGIDDWGGVSPVTADYVNPERPWPALERLRQVTEAAGRSLAPRLCVYPEFAHQPEQWLDDATHFGVLDNSDASGLARDHDLGWYSGAPKSPPQILPPLAADVVGGTGLAADGVGGGAVAEVLRGLQLGHQPQEAEIVTLFEARGPDLLAVTQAADELRQELAGDEVTWVFNRNINYTNVCTFKCRFCGFSKGPLSLNLRGEPYLLTLDDIAERSAEASKLGATEVCLQGGIHPDFDGEYYIDVARAVAEAAPDLHIHGFTALEVTEGARRLGEPLEEYLLRLMAAGLKSLPGTAAEILDDEIRDIICPDKITTEQWLEAHRVAHGIGLRSNITIMFGSVEHPRHWARHLLRTKELQRQTGGFTEFVPLPFVHMASPIYLRRQSRRGPTFRETLLMHSVARLVYGELVPNIQVSWVKLGLKGAAQALQAGANDLGGTLINENISRAAGAEHGQMATAQDFARITRRLGRELRQRTTLYEPMATPEMQPTSATQ